MSERFRSAKTLSLAAIGGLAATAGVALLDILVGFIQIMDPYAFVFTETDEIPGWLMLVGLAALLQFPIFIATVIAFLLWEYRAHSNLNALKPENLEFTPGWAVGWWFVPFLNLFKPFQAMREIWWESDPDGVNFNDEPTFLSASLHSAPGFMTIWWAFWIISNIANNLASRAFDPDNPESAAIGGTVVIAAGILTIIAAVLAITVVRDITDRQERRSIVVGNIQPAEPPPPPTFGDPRQNI